MTPDNADDKGKDIIRDPEPAIFSAIITPHRSLGRRGFSVLMILFGGVSFMYGTAFLLMGAWPVFGFLGLDVLLLYGAFRLNYRYACAYEEITLTPSTLMVRKVSHHGRVREWVLNPLWVRLEQVIHEEFGAEHVFLVSHGKPLAVANCLSPGEKASFARALSAALYRAKRGVTRTLFS